MIKCLCQLEFIKLQMCYKLPSFKRQFSSSQHQKVQEWVSFQRGLIKSPEQQQWSLLSLLWALPFTASMSFSGVWSPRLPTSRVKWVPPPALSEKESHQSPSFPSKRLRVSICSELGHGWRTTKAGLASSTTCPQSSGTGT